ncbi:hypothetical protein Aph01nite_76670 [Acrocarpospora phusangensis]|uniref:Uncharacterized protein n=1 Tax=Acrocarpospora phusangensis TaxID=1070424 RepID=A0A919USL2_9ACTN|nr:hypothetical protein Aph01nite_76670 [Acrocarpospora phusangensis]
MSDPPNPPPNPPDDPPTDPPANPPADPPTPPPTPPPADPPHGPGDRLDRIENVVNGLVDIVAGLTPKDAGPTKLPWTHRWGKD